MTVVVFGLVIAPFTASGWLANPAGLPSGYMKDTLGRYDEWEDPETHEWGIEIRCPDPDPNIHCRIFVPDRQCSVPDMPGYFATADSDNYYFLAEEWEDGYINADDGEATMLVPKDWLNAVWPPPGCE